MVLSSLARFVRAILRVLRRLKHETRAFRSSLKEVVRAVIDRIIAFIQRKYHCLKVRKRMTKVGSYAEWEAYAKLLDHLEGNVDWKY